MAELTFFTGAMDSGKSTLALQANHNRQARGLVGRLFTTHDRAGAAVVSSRLGLTHDATEVSSAFDFWRYTVDAQVLQVEALCWCGKRATHNARVEDGIMVTEGEVIVVGDTDEQAPQAERPGQVSYEVLCRKHHRRGLTAGRARAMSLSAEPLPFDQPAHERA